KDKGFLVSSAKDASSAIEMIGYYKFDLLIVDIMMPKETGLEFLQKLRESSNVPVVLLTAMGETGDRVAGLEIGADDYIAKPFEPKELVLRINSILRRTQKDSKKAKDKLSLGACMFDVVKKELTTAKGEIIHITPVEQTLMVILGGNLGQVFDREKLADMLGAGQSPRSIDVQITRLRKKIEKDSKNPRYLQTVRGKGYMLLED
ncbi:MAG: response regulator transcription factor, partial [Lactobacillus sp.]|nr:response regulator transcription factor [Lactobacillus sp.]